jgi:dCMP deaminase
MRPTRDEWALNLAELTSERSTCYRRHVGCVLLNGRGHVIATGYNGVAAGLPHCNEVDPFDPVGMPYICPGAFMESGKGLDSCQAIHAEQNALLQCRDVYTITTCYVTASPCVTCVKLLMNTSCSRIVFLEEYPHKEAEVLWKSAGKIWQLGAGSQPAAFLELGQDLL